MAPYKKAEAIREGYVSACEAVLNRGGEIAEGAGIDSLPLAIRSIPRDAGLAYYTDAPDAYRVTVPLNAEEYAKITHLGGMTYKDGNTLIPTKVTELRSEGANLIPCPYNSGESYSQSGVTFTQLPDGGVYIKGTPSDQATYNLSFGTKFFDSDYVAAVTSDLSATDGNMCLSKSGTEARKVVLAYQVHSTGKPHLYINITKYFAGQEFDGTVYPMLNYGAEPLPYKPYVGVIDTLKIPEALQNHPSYGAGLGKENCAFVFFDGKVFIERVKTRVLTASDAWMVYAPQEARPEGTYCYYVEFTNKFNYSGTSICSHFENVYGAWYSGKVGEYSDHKSLPYAYFVTDKPTLEEWLEWLANNPITVTYSLLEHTATDVSAIIPNGFIKVEAGGTITAVNEHGQAVPMAITYLLSQEV